MVLAAAGILAPDAVAGGRQLAAPQPPEPVLPAHDAETWA